MPRIAWFSPISERELMRSSVYTREVLSYAQAHLPEWDIEVFSDSADLKELEQTNSSEMLYGYPLFHYLRFYLRDRERAFDYVIYQCEDHPRAAFIQTSLALHPGVSFFHDLNLSRLEQSLVEHSSTGALLNDMMDETHGRSSVRLGDLKARGWSIDVFDRQYPQGESALRQAGVIVVQNIRGVQEVKARAIPRPVELSTFPFPRLDRSAVSAAHHALRPGLGIDATEPVIGFSGTRLLEDRVQTVLEAFSLLRQKHSGDTPKPRFLWVVNDKEVEAMAERQLKRFFAENDCPETAVNLVHADSVDQFFDLLSVPDVMICTTFDALRGQSLALIASLCYGTPTLVSDFGPSGELPDGVALRIPVGRGEREIIVRATEELLSNAALRTALSEASAEFVNTVCTAGSAVSDIERIFSAHGVELKNSLAAVRADIERQTESLLSEMSRVCRTDKLFSGLNRFSGERAVYNGGQILERATQDFSWGRQRALPANLKPEPKRLHG